MKIALSAFPTYHEKSVACAMIKELQIQDSSTVTKLSIITFMERVKQLVMEKYDFEYRDKSDLISFYWPHWTMKIPPQGS